MPHKNLVYQETEQVYPGATFQDRRCMASTFLGLTQKVGGRGLSSSLSTRHQQWHELVNYVGKHGFLGIMLTTAEQNRWGFITRDFEDNQQFRYTTFDRRGFIGHGTYLTAEEACVALFDMGLRIVDDPHRLDEVSKNCNWYIE